MPGQLDAGRTNDSLPKGRSAGGASWEFSQCLTFAQVFLNAPFPLSLRPTASKFGEMDPLSALGLACNLISVVEFAWKILGKAREIYRSPSGRDEESQFSELLLGDIHKQQALLSDLPEATEELRALQRESKSILNDVSYHISKLRTRKRSKLESTVAALRAAMTEDKVEGLIGRLERLQTQINTHLLRMTT